MRIAINARSILLANRTGIGRYTFHLIDSLGKIDRANHYWVYAPMKLWDSKRRAPKFSYSNFSIKKDFMGVRSFKKADIFHHPSPGPMDIECKKLIVTIHDLIYKTYPQSHTQETLDLTEKYMQQITQKADHIICVSRSTQNDLHRFINFPKEKCSVVYNGVDHHTFYLLNEGQRQQARKTLIEKGITEPFILFTGTLEPRKNLGGLLEAFSLLRSQKKFKGKIVVVGRKGWMHQPTEDLIDRLELRNETVFLGHVSDPELRALYNLAEVFVLPSFYEGFGFPIVEAFCCGAAVVTSRHSSCGEIAADAALTIDPHSPEDIAGAISQLLEDRVLNQRIRHKAVLRSKDFSFLKTAQETLKVYETVAL